MRKRGRTRASAGVRAERLLELPAGTLSQLPQVVLSGNRQVVVENSRQLCVYEEDRICLDTACGQLQILGHRLCLTALTRETVAISGRILAVEFLE